MNAIKSHYRSVDFLNREAEFLDAWEMDEWLELLTDDIRYVAPLRVTKEVRDRAEEFSSESFHFDEDKAALRTRVEKAKHEYSWSHIPPMRDRRFVSNVRVTDRQENEYEVKSNLLVRIGERDVPDAVDMISCVRRDTLREVEEDLRLARREIYFDDTTFDLPLIIFF